MTLTAAIGYIILAAGTCAWLLPMVLQRRRSETPQRLDRRARWGILLVGVGYSLLWQTRFWTRSPAVWRVVCAGACFIFACVFSWSATRALGRHWRIEAGLNKDHELVRSGVYRFVRHPIYTSMLFAVIGTGLILAPLYLVGVSVLLYMLGTEIRVQIEDGLLASRFGQEFQSYRRSVPAYIPVPKLTNDKSKRSAILVI
jgi:protein-S-isoprenylcysteine O-methyltransferase Ste14